MLKLRAVSLTALLTAMPTVVMAASISDIRVQGSERIDPQTVLTYMDVRKGDEVTADTTDTVIKSLFGTGLFSDVSARMNGSVLEVFVTENPVVNKVAFEGNDAVTNEVLESEVSLKPRQVFTRTKVQTDVARLYQIYEKNGYFSISVEPKIIKLDQNRVDLVFEIDEGQETLVDQIRFVGNKRFSDDQLRGVVSTKESRWYSFFGSNDKYDSDRLSFDQELLRRFYLSEGYADFRVITAQAELAADKRSFFLTYTVEEGDRYEISNINISSTLPDFDASTLDQYVTFGAGDWYDVEEVQNSVDAMTTALADRQFNFVAVRPDVKRDRENKKIDLVFNVSETQRQFVERIDIKGNSRTLDKVIRREMDLAEGDPLDRRKLAESEKNIRNLGYFEKMEVKTTPGSAPDKQVVDVEVAEQSTGEVSFGAGYSTTDGPLADIRLRESNFLGRGQEFLLGATVAGERTQFDFSFTEPYFLDRDLSAGVDLFHMTRDFQDEASFDQTQTGGGFRFGYPLSEHWRQTLRYRIEQNEITDVDGNASRYIRDQEGERVTSAISQRLAYEDLDSRLFPTDGVNAWFDTEYAGLGGDANYVSGRLGLSYYYPLLESVTLNLMGEGGAIAGVGDEDVEINERFYLGGQTMRGFERAGVGPRDVLADDSLGGNVFYRGTAEVSFPIGFPKEMGIQGHAFNDIGALWDIDEPADPNLADENSLRAAAGVGVSWRSPFGPVRVDLAFPYVKEDFDKTESFRFNFGTRF